MKITLKEEHLQDILDHIEKNRFSADGCACGEWGYQLEDNLFIFVYRSCRKSNNTPDHKLWEIHDLEFYRKAIFHYEEYKGNSYLNYVEVDSENLIENVKIDTYQKELIINKLKEITVDSWGEEFRE